MPRPAKTKEAIDTDKRMNLIFDIETVQATDWITKRFRSGSMTETLRRSVHFIKSLYEGLEPGDEIIIKKRDGSEKGFFLF